MVELQEHGTEDLIECYTMGKLGEAETARFEEHMLLCEECREQAEYAEGMRRAMRQALMEVPARPSVPSLPARGAGWLDWLRQPMGIAAMAMLALVAAMGIFSGGRGSVPAVASLQLTAVRGDMPVVGRSRELDLRLTGIAAGEGPYRMEVVNAQGQRVWSSLTGSDGDAATARVQAQLRTGDYFVRLYDTGGAILREYGFAVHD